MQTYQRIWTVLLKISYTRHLLESQIFLEKNAGVSRDGVLVALSLNLRWRLMHFVLALRSYLVTTVSTT